MSVADASDSDIDRGDDTVIIVGESPPVEPERDTPRTPPITRTEDFDQLADRLNRESEEREQRFMQDMATAEGERRVLLERLQRMERNFHIPSQTYDHNAFDTSVIDPSILQQSTPIRTARSSRASRAGSIPVPSPILTSPNREMKSPHVNFHDVYGRQQAPRTEPAREVLRPIANVTQVTTPSQFVTAKPISHLTVPGMMQLRRLYNRHMVRPGNAGLIIFLYSTEYFNMSVLDYIENVLNTYYGSQVASMIQGDSDKQPPHRETLESMEPDDLFEEIYKCFIPTNKKDLEYKLGQVVSSCLLEKPCSSWSMSRLSQWQMTIEYVIKNVREFITYVPEKSTLGRYMPYHGGLKPNVPQDLKGLVQIFVKDWFNSSVLSALRDTFPVPERNIYTLGEWMNHLEVALHKLRKMHNPIAQITKACDMAERDRRTKQTTKNINETSLNSIVSPEDMQVLSNALADVDRDFDHDYNAQQYQTQEESLNAMDVRRPQASLPATDTAEAKPCFRTIGGDSCDPKKCTFSHEPSVMRKFLVDAIARHDSKYSRQSVKAIATEELVEEPGSQTPKKSIEEKDLEEDT